MKHTPWQLRAAAMTALTAAAWLGGQALAQTNATPPSQAAPGATTADRNPPVQPGGSHDVRASRLIGMDVYNTQGREIGEIKDLVIDVNNQRVPYAVLAVGGFLGLGEKLYAFPAHLLQFGDDLLLVDLTEARLRRAPAFDRDGWPDWNDPARREPIDRYHGAGAAPGAPPDARLVRASEIIGRDINDTGGADAGEIEDLVLNLESAQVRYAVVDFDKAWSPDDRLLALPLDTLSLPAAGKGDAVLQVPRDKLDMANGFDDDRWPDLNDPQYREHVERQLPAYQPWSSRLGPRARGADTGGTNAPPATPPGSVPGAPQTRPPRVP